MPILKYNIPGPDWTSSFIKLYEILLHRMCQNIKCSHADVQPVEINQNLWQACSLTSGCGFVNHFELWWNRLGWLQPALKASVPPNVYKICKVIEICCCLSVKSWITKIYWNSMNKRKSFCVVLWTKLKQFYIYQYWWNWNHIQNSQKSWRHIG